MERPHRVRIERHSESVLDRVWIDDVEIRGLLGWSYEAGVRESALTLRLSAWAIDLSIVDDGAEVPAPRERAF